jgi:MFS-type transporter involved in bile tolerance (Atg22 family)
MQNHNCPQCGSENTSTFAMINRGGTTTGSFGAVSYGLNAGVIGTKGKTSNQSVLAQQTAPPPKAGRGAGVYVLAGFAGLVGYGLINAILNMFGYELISVMGLVVFAVVSFIAYVFLDKHERAKTSEWEDEMQTWNNSWMCLKCGFTFISRAK